MEKQVTNKHSYLRKPKFPLDGERNLLERASLISILSNHFLNGRRLFFIQAQAGQGKTTLARLFLRRIQKNFCWHQVQAQNKDPVFFLTSFYRSLTRAFNGFTSDLAATMFDKCEVTAQETPRVFSWILKDLNSFQQEDFFIVIDDLHLLIGSPSSSSLIETLIGKLPRNACLMLLSRRPVTDVAHCKTDRFTPVEINNRHLALSKTEIAEFFNTVLQLAIPPEEVQRLHYLTEGWIMGLLLAGRALANDPALISQDLSMTAATLPTSDVLDYLVSELLSNFTPRLHHALLALSILPEASLSLAKELGYDDVVIGDLERMVSRDYFMRFSDDGTEDSIVFHHLFKKCLQDLAARKLKEAQRQTILQAAAHRFLSANRLESALHCFLEGRFYPEADRVLENVGLSLFASNQLMVLQLALEKVPDETIYDFPWLSFFNGIVRLNTDPTEALAYFNAAQSIFLSEGNELGELMVLTQMTFYFVAVALEKHQDGLVERLQTLFNRHRTKLVLNIEIQALISISQGFCFFKGNPDRTLQYAAEALQLSETNGLDNFIAASRITRAYQFAFLGKWREFATEANSIMLLCRRQRVSSYYRHAIDFLQIDILFGWGDFSNYARRKKMLEEKTGRGLFRKNAFGPYIRLREIDYFIASGRYPAAAQQLQKILNDSYINQRPHLMSQCLQYQALLAALRNNASEARRAAELSIKQRNQIGMPLFLAHNRFFTGAAYAALGENERSENLFDQALSISRQMGELAFRSGTYAHRAALRLKAGREESAREDVASFLKYMKRARYRHFFGWTPDVGKLVLTFAVRNGIEPELARELAAESLDIAITDTGQAIPLLRIRTLGTFEIMTEPSRVIRGYELTQGQRQLFGLLLSSPGHSLSSGAIQSSLWPDSTEKKARAAFDTLVSRLRSALKKALGERSGHRYLRLEKGMLSLSNCRCDAAAFMAHTHKGLDHFRKKEFWQADNSFYTALQLWQGEFMPGVDLCDPAGLFRSEIQNRYLDSVIAWCTILMDNGQLSKAIKLAEQALQIDDINHVLVKILYRLHSLRDDPVRTAKTINNYRESLNNAGFEIEEIEGIVESLFAPS